MSGEKRISFTDRAGRMLFSVPDGGFIQMIYGNGEEYVARCRRIDETHIQIDGVKYSTRKFALKMEKNGISFVPAGG